MIHRAACSHLQAVYGMTGGNYVWSSTKQLFLAYWLNCCERHMNFYRSKLSVLYSLETQRYVFTCFPEFQIAVHSALRAKIIEYRPFWDKCIESSQMTFNTTRFNVPQLCVNSVMESEIKLKSVSLYRQLFSSCQCTIQGKNKKPRGLDVLLGHLLDKRISVRYKLTGSSTNRIAENLSQK